MLESLTIKNYAIISEMAVNFTPGLNIITGETGAGKSIVVDALEIALGARASTDMIRTGAELFEVTGVFSLENKLAGVETVDADDSVMILRREVRSDGNSRCFINDRPVTLRTLKEAGDALVDFHGQHDHQSLFFVREHIGFLDGYGGLGNLSARVSEIYKTLIEKRTVLKNLLSETERRIRDRELFEYQLDEIDKAGIKPGEEDELESSIRRLSGAQMLKELGMKIFSVLSESEGSIDEQVSYCIADVRSMSGADDGLSGVMEKMENLSGEITELSRFFRDYSDRVEDDPQLLAELEERLSLIEKLKKKYGHSIEAVCQYRDRIKNELDTVVNAESEIENLGIDIVALENDYLNAAEELTDKRREYAPRLSAEAESHLAELGMKGARLIIQVSQCESGEFIERDGVSIPIGSDGKDRVEFLISANSGETPRPLVKVASGGEISRVMLSLKLALSGAGGVPTMVFDEIDTGVSGRIAESIGKKLVQLTGGKQAIVITHLPQIAMMADTHFSARKEIKEGRTMTKLVSLDSEMRQRELAMLLSGEELSETAFAHAKELLDAAKKNRETVR